MIRKALSLAAAVAMSAATPATAQEVSQDELQERYDRALAAGYKALFLCSAIAHAERNGATRTPESVHEWELSGIQTPLEDVIRDLPFEIFRGDAGIVRHVLVDWADDMPPRIARHDFNYGCVVLPIGWDPETLRSELDVPAVSMETHDEEPSFSFTLGGATGKSDARTIREPSALDLVFGAAMKSNYGEGSRTTALVTRRGFASQGLVAQARYRAGFDEKTPQRTWSVAKSIAATLVGMAIENGAPCAENHSPVNPEYGAADPRREVTIDHLLRMASGRFSDTAGARTDPLYWGGTTVGERAANWPLVHAPGTVFRYANNDTLMAIEAIKCSFEEDPISEQFAALGMEETIAETDWQGNYILSSQVWATANDLATLGQLYLNNGVTQDGTRILPENWLEYISTPSGPQPDGPLGYGASWWLVNKSQGIPADTIAALGNRGQYLIVVPSRDMVIVRRGEDPVGSRFDFVSFTRDVLAALATDDAPAP